MSGWSAWLPSRATCPGLTPTGRFLGAVFYGGLGAGIGVGIDALITREQDVFRGPARGPQVRLQPLWQPTGGMGLRVAIVF